VTLIQATPGVDSDADDGCHLATTEKLQGHKKNRCCLDQ